MTTQEKLVKAAKDMLSSGRLFKYKNPGFGETENGRQCWCCVTVASYWVYEAFGVAWNIGSSKQKHGYFWSPRCGGDWSYTLRKFGFESHSFSSIGKSGLRSGDILVANDHTVMMTSATTLAESVPSSPYLREVAYYKHNWLYVWRLPDSQPDKEKEFSMTLKALKKGSQGAEVKTLQSVLNGKFGYKLRVDGDYGNLTVEAIKSYQKGHKDVNGKALYVDGEAGELTLGSLYKL